MFVVQHEKRYQLGLECEVEMVKLEAEIGKLEVR